MKIIYSITDMHLNIDAIKASIKVCKKTKVDFVICPGDYTWFNSGSEETLNELNKYPVPLILTYGNHENLNEQKELITKYKNIIFKYKHSHKIDNIFILIYGGGGFAMKDKIFMKFANEEIQKSKKDDFTILLTHGPPHGTFIDVVRNNFVGSKDYTKFIKDHKIDLALSGHLHDCEELYDTIGKSVVVNPGYRGQIFIINNDRLSKEEFENQINELKQFKDNTKNIVNENVCIINPFE